MDKIKQKNLQKCTGGFQTRPYKKKIIIFSLALLITGCSLYKKPEVKLSSMPEKFRNQLKFTPKNLNHNWWENFNDPQLTKLINLALKNNLNYQIAVKNILIAKTYVTEYSAAFFPQPNLNFGASRNATSSNSPVQQSTGLITPSAGTVSPFNLTQLNASVIYEVDLWHRIGNSVAGAKAGVGTSVAARDIIKLTLLSNVANTYWQIQAVEMNIDNLEQQYAASEAVVKESKTQYKSGLTNIELVDNAKTQMENIDSSLEALNKQKQILINTLAYLVGEYPEKFNYPIKPKLTHVNFNHLVPAGIPAKIIINRPDVQQAYYQALNAGYIEKQSLAAFFPTVNLTGTYGFASSALGNLINANSSLWNLGVTLTEPLINYMKVAAQHTRAKLQFEAALLNYKNVAIGAYQEVDNALISYEKDYRIMSSYQKMTQYAAEKLRTAKAKYNAGLINDSNYQTYRLAYLQSQVNYTNQTLIVFADVVQIYKSFGVGV